MSPLKPPRRGKKGKVGRHGSVRQNLSRVTTSIQYEVARRMQALRFTYGKLRMRTYCLVRYPGHTQSRISHTLQQCGVTLWPVHVFRVPRDCRNQWESSPTSSPTHFRLSSESDFPV